MMSASRFLFFVERLTRPVPYGWVAHSTCWGAVLFLARHSLAVNWFFDTVVRGPGGSTPSEFAILAVNACVIVVLATLSLMMFRAVWSMASASVSRVDFRRFQSAPSESRPFTRVVITGVDSETLRSRAARATIEWSLNREEATVCPLPRVGLAGRELLLSAMIGALLITTGLVSAVEGRSVTLPHPVRSSALFMVTGLGPLLFSAAWAGWLPFHLWSVSVQPGRVRVQSAWSDSQAHVPFDRIHVRCHIGLLQFHSVTVAPASGRPWSLILPGQAVDLVIGALMSTGVADLTNDPY